MIKIQVPKEAKRKDYYRMNWYTGTDTIEENIPKIKLDSEVDNWPGYLTLDAELPGVNNLLHFHRAKKLLLS